MKKRVITMVLVIALGLYGAGCDDSIEGVQDDTEEGVEEIQEEIDDS